MADPREALQAIGQLADAEIDIGDAAIQLARIDAPDADWQAARRHLSELAQAVVRRAAQTEDLTSRAIILAEVLADEYQYTGDRETYDDPVNANLIRVIERRRGLPVALGIIWLHAARAAGWASHGVDFPSHFMIALEGRTTQVVVDSFNGGAVMAARDLRALLKRVDGPDAVLRPGLLQPMSTRRVLLRLQNNIMTRRLGAGDIDGGLRAINDMLLVAPEQAELWRQAGLINQKLNQFATAKTCYQHYLTLVPEGAVAEGVRMQLDILKSKLN